MQINLITILTRCYLKNVYKPGDNCYKRVLNNLHTKREHWLARAYLYILEALMLILVVFTNLISDWPSPSFSKGGKDLKYIHYPTHKHVFTEAWNINIPLKGDGVTLLKHVPLVPSYCFKKCNITEIQTDQWKWLYFTNIGAPIFQVNYWHKQIMVTLSYIATKPSQRAFSCRGA